jgi:ankyrin repeat protein
MPTLPAHPNLDQLRHQAKDLLRAAQAGDADASARIERVSDRLTLAAAQLALAREYGFASWPKLKEEVEACTHDLAQRVDAFCAASVRDGSGRAARLLAETPAIAHYNFATAVLLGDATRVRDELRRDPALATRPDPRTGWTALHAVCASRWHQFEPTRVEGLLDVARQLLDAGADPSAFSDDRRPGQRGHWSPLRCAVASANSGPSNQVVIELLLVHGAIPNDHDLYLAGFAHDRHRLLPLLLQHVPDVASLAEQALSAPISTNDVESVRILLEAGADPRRYHNDDGQPSSAVIEAIRAASGPDLVELLLAHHADPNARDSDGRSAYRLALARGRNDLAEPLRRHGADDDANNTDLFLSACLQADRDEAQRQLGRDPDLLDRLTDDERGAIVRAAETGKTAAVALMLDLGFPVETRGGDGASPLHVAAYAGSANTVRLLLDRGADIEARDTTWSSTPLDWAAVGSGEQPKNDPAANWTETVRMLLAAGASTKDITLEPDDPKSPNPEVAALLRAHADRRSSR